MSLKIEKAALLSSNQLKVAEQGSFKYDSTTRVNAERSSAWNVPMAENAPPLHLHLQALINNAAEGNPSVSDFFLRLDAAGVSVSVNIAKTRRISGISYLFGDKLVRGSELGKAYTWTGIQKQLGVQYDEVRDFAALEKKRCEPVITAVQDATSSSLEFEKLVALMTAVHNDAHDLLEQAVQERQVAAKKVEVALDEAKRHAVDAVSHVAAQTERAMQAIIASSKTIDTAAMRMKQEVFGIAIIVALVAGLGSALVTGLLMSQQTEKELRRFSQEMAAPAAPKRENFTKDIKFRP